MTSLNIVRRISRSTVSALLLMAVFTAVMPVSSAISSPASYPGGRVSVQGSGFLPTDTTCTLSSPSSPNLILTGTSACVIQMGTGIAFGGFIIGNVLPGYYVVQLTGNQGDFAQAIIGVE